MNSCDNENCIFCNSPKKYAPVIGSRIFIKPEKIAKEGTLPPNLSKEEKNGSFKILQSDNSEVELSFFLEMPVGKGRPMVINGQEKYVWAVYLSDIQEEKPSCQAYKKNKEETMNAIRGGDIIKTTRPDLLSIGVSKEDNEKGFRVLGVDDKGIYVDIPNNKGDIRFNYGLSTNVIEQKNAVIVQKHKLKVGEYVRIPKKNRSGDLPGDLPPNLNSSDYFHGFKILAIDGKILVLELPRDLGLRDSKYPGKSVWRVTEDSVELAPPMKARKGDKVRIKKGYADHIATRNEKKGKQFYDQDFEVVEVLGNDFKYLEWHIRCPDGIVRIYDESCLDFPVDTKDSKNKTSKVSSSKTQEESVSSKSSVFKEGMKVKVKNKNSLPDSFSDKERSKSFKILTIDEDEDLVVLEMPKSCDEAEYDSEYGCRVWNLELSDLEENGMAKNRGTVTERFVANAEKGAIKAVGRKLTKATKAGILRAADTAARAQGMNDGQVAAGIQMFTAFMESEFGNAFVSGLLGMALAHLAPQLPIPALQDERLQDLADEMSSEGSAIVMEKVVDMVMTYIAPGFADILQGLPPKKEVTTKVRVATEGKAKSKKKGSIKIGNHEVEVEGEHEAEAEEEATEKVKLTQKHAA